MGDAKEPKRDGPGETGRVAMQFEAGQRPASEFDNQGLEECLNRAPRDTDRL